MTKMKKNKNWPYRSGLENDIAKQLRNNKVPFDFEPSWGKLSYRIPAKDSTYLPDFYITTKSGKIIIIEGKGIWVFDDRYKHLLIKQQRPELDIRFVFQRANQRIRKGSKTTYRDICEGRGTSIFKDVTWKFSDGGMIPEEWMNE